MESIALLPLRLIFAMLPASNLFAAARVCRRWRDVLRDPAIWQEATTEHSRYKIWRRICRRAPVETVSSMFARLRVTRLDFRRNDGAAAVDALLNPDMKVARWLMASAQLALVCMASLRKLIDAIRWAANVGRPWHAIRIMKVLWPRDSYTPIQPMDWRLGVYHYAGQHAANYPLIEYMLTNFAHSPGDIRQLILKSGYGGNTEWLLRRTGWTLTAFWEATYGLCCDDANLPQLQRLIGSAPAPYRPGRIALRGPPSGEADAAPSQFSVSQKMLEIAAKYGSEKTVDYLLDLGLADGATVDWAACAAYSRGDTTKRLRIAQKLELLLPQNWIERRHLNSVLMNNADGELLEAFLSRHDQALGSLNVDIHILTALVNKDSTESLKIVLRNIDQISMRDREILAVHALYHRRTATFWWLIDNYRTELPETLGIRLLAISVYDLALTERIATTWGVTPQQVRALAWSVGGPMQEICRMMDFECVTWFVDKYEIVATHDSEEVVNQIFIAAIQNARVAAFAIARWISTKFGGIRRAIQIRALESACKDDMLDRAEWIADHFLLTAADIDLNALIVRTRHNRDVATRAWLRKRFA